MHSIGKLNADEFAVAMHLINKRLSGGILPPQLPPDLVPPSARTAQPSMDTSKQDFFRQDLLSDLAFPLNMGKSLLSESSAYAPITIDSSIPYSSTNRHRVSLDQNNTLAAESGNLMGGTYQSANRRISTGPGADAGSSSIRRSSNASSIPLVSLSTHEEKIITKKKLLDSLQVEVDALRCQIQMQKDIEDRFIKIPRSSDNPVSSKMDGELQREIDRVKKEEELLQQSLSKKMDTLKEQARQKLQSASKQYFSSKSTTDPSVKQAEERIGKLLEAWCQAAFRDSNSASLSLSSFASGEGSSILKTLDTASTPSVADKDAEVKAKAAKLLADRMAKLGISAATLNPTPTIAMTSSSAGSVESYCKDAVVALDPVSVALVEERLEWRRQSTACQEKLKEALGNATALLTKLQLASRSASTSAKFVTESKWELGIGTSDAISEFIQQLQARPTAVKAKETAVSPKPPTETEIPRSVADPVKRDTETSRSDSVTWQSAEKQHVAPPMPPPPPPPIQAPVEVAWPPILSNKNDLPASEQKTQPTVPAIPSPAKVISEVQLQTAVLVQPAQMQPSVVVHEAIVSKPVISTSAEQFLSQGTKSPAVPSPDPFAASSPIATARSPVSSTIQDPFGLATAIKSEVREDHVASAMVTSPLQEGPSLQKMASDDWLSELASQHTSPSAQPIVPSAISATISNPFELGKQVAQQQSEQKPEPFVPSGKSVKDIAKGFGTNSGDAAAKPVAKKSPSKVELAVKSESKPTVADQLANSDFMDNPFADLDRAGPPATVNDLFAAAPKFPAKLETKPAPADSKKPEPLSFPVEFKKPESIASPFGKKEMTAEDIFSDAFADSNDPASAFPKNELAPIVVDPTPIRSAKFPFLAGRALYDYKPQQSDELSMVRGMLVTIPDMQDQSVARLQFASQKFSIDNDDWWFGRQENGVCGWFPSSYVDIITDFRTTASATLPKFKACKEYLPRESDELALNVELEVCRLEMLDDSWWKCISLTEGASFGTIGVCPASYLESSSHDSKNSLLDPADNPFLNPFDVPVTDTKKPPLQKIPTNVLFRNFDESKDEGGLFKQVSNVQPASVEVTMEKPASFRARAKTNPDISAMAQVAAQQETWAQIVGVDRIKEMSEEQRKRQEAIYELIRTESTYVRNLQHVVEVGGYATAVLIHVDLLHATANQFHLEPGRPLWYFRQS